MGSPLHVVKQTFEPIVSSKYAQEMNDVIDQFEVRSWSTSNNGFLTGFKGVDNAFEGLQTGFHIIAGDSNHGKSSMISQMAWQIAMNNPNAYVIDFSLDDPIHEKLARVVASNSRIPINAAKMPYNYSQYPEVLARRKNGISLLHQHADKYRAYDSTHSTDIEVIENTIKDIAVELKIEGKNRKICVFIDSFHDLSTTNRHALSSEKTKYEYLAQYISDMATMLDIVIVCTAELRKLNGTRRPIPDDIREATKIKYEAKSIMLCYNEVSVKGDSSSIYYELNNSPVKQPIFEIKVGKNKYSSFKGRLFFEFYPELAMFQECDSANSKRFNNLIYSN